MTEGNHSIPFSAIFPTRFLLAWVDFRRAVPQICLIPPGINRNRSEASTGAFDDFWRMRWYSRACPVCLGDLHDQLEDPGWAICAMCARSFPAFEVRLADHL